MLKMTRGYTLAEVLIVVVIVAILASLIIPRFGGQKEWGVVAEAVGILSAIRKGEADYHSENNNQWKQLDSTSTAADWKEIGFDAPPDMINFTYSVGQWGMITATRAGSGDFAGKTMVMWTNGIFDQNSSTHPYTPKS